MHSLILHNNILVYDIRSQEVQGFALPIFSDEGQDDFNESFEKMGSPNSKDFSDFQKKVAHTSLIWSLTLKV